MAIILAMTRRELQHELTDAREALAVAQARYDALCEDGADAFDPHGARHICHQMRAAEHRVALYEGALRGAQ
jgi:hypothetical protein